MSPCIDNLEARRLLAATYVVDPNATQEVNGTYRTITAALQAAANTPEVDVIDVVAGAINEEVNVNTPVVLHGARFSNAGETLLTGGFTVTAAGVTIDSFTILNGSSSAVPASVVGVNVAANGATIQHNRLTGNAGTGSGIVVASSVDAGTTTLSGNTVEQWATGLDVRAGGTVSVAGNVLRDNSIVGVTFNLTAASAASAVGVSANTFDNPNAPQIRLNGGDASDLVTLSNSVVTLKGTATYLDVAAATPLAGESSGTFTLVRSTLEDVTLHIDLDVDGTGFGTYNHVALAGSASADQSIITYVPTANFNGVTSFDFTTMGGATGVVNITVTPVNDDPAITATLGDRSVIQGNTLTLALADFFGDVDLADATPDALSFGLSGAPSFVTIVHETGVVTIAPTGPLSVGQYTFTATATDGDATASQTITLTVHRPNNAAPSLAAIAAITLAEDAAPAPLRTASATDAEGDDITYSIAGGNEAGRFAIDPITGVISLVGALDAEQAQSYALIIRATDDGDPAPAFSEQTFAVTVTDLNEAAGSVAIVGPGGAFEGVPVTFNAVPTDPDVGASFTYQWFVDDVEQPGQTGASFSVGFANESTHAIRVVAIDRTGSPTSATKTLVVADSPPTVPLSLSSASVDEGASLTLTIGTITDSGAGDVNEIGQLVVDWGDGTYAILNSASDGDSFDDAIAGTPIQFSHVYSDGSNASRTITVRIWDNAGHAYSVDTSVLVRNVAPVGNFVALTPSVQAGSLGVVNWFSQGDVSPEDRVAGLRYTYAIDGNGNGLYDAGETLIAGDGTYEGSVTNSQLTIPGSFLETAGSYSILGLLFDKDGTPFLTRQASIVVTPGPLRVISLGGDHSGFTVVFNQRIDRSVLNLFDGTDDANDTADVVLTRAGGQSVRGSIILAADGKGFDYVVTGGILPAGTYTVTLRSSSAAFRDLNGGLLDGDGNGSAGGNFVATFGVNAPPGPVLSMADFARGPGQSVDVIPGNANSDLPVMVNTPIAISSFNFQIRYNSSLLSVRPPDAANGVADVYAGAGLPAGWAVDYAIGVDAINVSLTKTNPTAPDIAAGFKELIKIRATVPNDPAIYGKSHYLSFANIVVNGNASIEGTADRAVHKVIFLGDANMDGTVNVADGALIQSVVLGTATGFDKFGLIDPAIIVDSSRNAAVDAQDATNAVLSGFTNGRPADMPAFNSVTLPSTLGADPTFKLGQILTRPGSTVSVPISVIDDARGVQSGSIRVNYDPTKLDLADVPMVAGSVLGSGWAILTNVNEAQGYIEIAFYSGSALGGTAAVTGNLATLSFNVPANAADGTTPISIGTPSNLATSPTIFFDKQGRILTTSAVSGSIKIDTLPPTTTGNANFSFGGSVQSLSITFDEDVSGSIAALDFELLNLKTNTAVSLVLAGISADGRTVTLQFANTGGIKGSILTDGDYRFRVLAGQVSDALGNTLAENRDTPFFFSNADINHDRSVNFDDLLVLAKHYGQHNNTFADGDVDYDGDVDFDDLLTLAKKYGTTLTAPVSSTPVASATPTRKRADAAAGIVG